MYLFTLKLGAYPHTDAIHAADVVRLIDLKQLLPTGLLSEKLVAEVLKTYHSSNGKIVSDGNNKVRRSAFWHVKMHASLWGRATRTHNQEWEVPKKGLTHAILVHRSYCISMARLGTRTTSTRPAKGSWG
jgi:hypothetical protein